MARKGIPQITIPLRPNEVTIENVERYLDDIFVLFSENAGKIHADYDKYCLDHNILSKERLHNDSEANNIVVVPDLKAMVDWKTGYVLGNPIKYAQGKSRNTDDILYLNKYLRSSCKRTVDKEVATYAYATGVGYYFIEPKSYDFDIENEAPFELYCRAPDTCAKIYSAYGGHKPLFDILYTTYIRINSNKVKQTIKVLDIYLPTMLYTYECDGASNWRRVRSEVRPLYHKLPLVEKRLNRDGIGIVAMGEPLQNAIDSLISNGLDNVDDIVNEVYVYVNCNLGESLEEQQQNHISMKRNGAIVLDANSPDFPADIKTLTPKMTLAEIRELTSSLNVMLHSIVGVPLEVSNSNSGGTTKQGSEVANGYDNAYNRALDDINSFIRADTELLEKIMWICQNSPYNKMDNIATSDIEISYCINLTDNILTKAQAYGIFAQTMPPDMAVRVTKISNDPEADGMAILQRMEELRRENATVETVNENIDVKE